MRKENLDQDLGWAPTQYAGYNSFDTGEWRIVEEDGAQTAVIYTNFSSSAGVVWLKQTDTVMEMRKLFIAGAESGMPAADTSGAVASKFSEHLRPMSTGTLDGVNATMQAMMQRSS